MDVLRASKAHSAAILWLGLLAAGCTMSGAAEKETTSGSGATGANDSSPLGEGTNATTSDLILLEVNKDQLKADLRTWPEDETKSNHLMTFRIAIGKQEGDKQVEGDNKTPEGIYFTQNIIDGSTLPQKYGAKAIPINFPNPHDQMLKKTGHGIWLHGVEADQRVEQAKVTEGCVAFYNADIHTLSRWLKPYQAVVVITKGEDQANMPGDIQAVRSAALDWADAWANRDLERYASYYSDDFRFKQLDRNSYAEYKGKVFKSYKDMKVDMTGLRVFTHPKYAMTLMNQDFNGDNRYISKGRKILYWTRGDDGRWQIVREVFENRRIELVSFTAGEVAKLSENSPSANYDAKGARAATPQL